MRTDRMIVESLDFPAAPATARLGLGRCLHHAKLMPSDKGKPAWVFRVGGILRAEEVGFVELRRGGVAYIWLAASKRQARRAARIANQQNLKSNIGTNIHNARAHGRGIVALSVTPKIRDPKEVEAIYHCLK